MPRPRKVVSAKKSHPYKKNVSKIESKLIPELPEEIMQIILEFAILAEHRSVWGVLLLRGYKNYKSVSTLFWKLCTAIQQKVSPSVSINETVFLIIPLKDFQEIKISHIECTIMRRLEVIQDSSSNNLHDFPYGREALLKPRNLLLELPDPSKPERRHGDISVFFHRAEGKSIMDTYTEMLSSLLRRLKKRVDLNYPQSMEITSRQVFSYHINRVELNQVTFVKLNESKIFDSVRVIKLESFDATDNSVYQCIQKAKCLKKLTIKDLFVCHDDHPAEFLIAMDKLGIEELTIESLNYSDKYGAYPIREPMTYTISNIKKIDQLHKFREIKNLKVLQSKTINLEIPEYVLRGFYDNYPMKLQSDLGLASLQKATSNTVFVANYFRTFSNF